MKTSITGRAEQSIYEVDDAIENVVDAKDLKISVDEILRKTTVFDLHTHLFAPEFGEMNLWGIDELLNYHYLVAEMFRSSTISPEDFWRLEKTRQADLIWKTLFVENTPVSEATRGVITVLNVFGLDTRAANLKEAREFFSAQNPTEFIDRVLKITNVTDIGMTNDPLDETEIAVWNGGAKIDSRFHASIRLDRILNDWQRAVPLLQKQNYRVSEILDKQTVKETRRFLQDWIRRMNPIYLGVSLSDDFTHPEESTRGKLLKEAVFPICKENNIAFSLMIGVRRQINPTLRLAGDGVGRADVSAVSRICSENPEIKFLATFLSRENQHELCVIARKFPNLMPFGCWWFLNNPSIIKEITSERIEMLGTSFIPQHSDARIFDQLIYKWDHSRRIIGDALYESYAALLRSGRGITRKEIRRDAEKLFSGNFRSWAGINKK